MLERWKCGVKGTLLHCWWECKLIQSLWKTVWWFLKKLRIKPPFDPEIPLVGIYSEETKTEKDTCTPVFTAALFTIVRTWKQLRCPLTDEWVKKLWYIYTMEYYSALKRNVFESIPKKTYRWLTNTWKDAQHHSLLEKRKSNLQWDTTSYQSDWPSSKRLQTINAGEGVEKREGSCTVGGNVNWHS